jgi:hypothetical protein
MYVPTMIVTVCIVIADLIGQWRPYVPTHDDCDSWYCQAMKILTVTIIVGTYI